MRKWKWAISIVFYTFIIGACIVQNNVKVDTMNTMEQLIGSDATKFSKIQIYSMGKSKTITNQSEIGNLLKDISLIQLEKQQNDPKMDGGTYTIKFYPSNNVGTFTFSDGGSGNFSKESNCTFPVPVGCYQIKEDSSFDTWMKTMNRYFNSVYQTGDSQSSDKEIESLSSARNEQSGTILSDLDYNSEDFTKIAFDDSSLPYEFVSYYTGMHRGKGSTKPVIYQGNGEKLYLIVYQNSDKNGIIHELKFEGENEKPTVTIKSTANQS